MSCEEILSTKNILFLAGDKHKPCVHLKKKAQTYSIPSVLINGRSGYGITIITTVE